MSDSLFWKIVAGGAIAVAALFVAAPLWAPPGGPGTSYADAAGGAIGGVISFPQEIQSQERVYIVDTKGKVILVYSNSSGNYSFNFVTGRSYNFDVQATVKLMELKYNQRGYPIQQTMGVAQMNR